MLGELQALRLIIRANALAVKLPRPRQHLLIDETADDLAVLQDERHFARAHLEHRAGAAAAGALVAETRIEEAGIVHAEFADQRIERHHLGGIIRRHLHRFLGRQDIELVGIEHQASVGARRHRLPEIGNVVAGAPLDVDQPGMALGAIADEVAGPKPGQIDSDCDAVARRRHCRHRPAARADAARAGPRHRAAHAAAEADLRQPRALAHQHRKSARD